MSTAALFVAAGVALDKLTAVSASPHMNHSADGFDYRAMIATPYELSELTNLERQDLHTMHLVHD